MSKQSEQTAAATQAAIEKAEEMQRESTRRMALEEAPGAMKRMVKIAKGHKLPGGDRPSPNTQFNANKEILNQAHGRPETRDGRTGQAEAGLTIVINQLTTGDGPKTVRPPQELLVPAEHPGEALILDVDQAIEIADSLQKKRAEQAGE